MRHSQLHRRLPDGSRRFRSGTCGTAFSLPGLRREPDEEALQIEVRAVSEPFTSSEPAGTVHPW
ncbi:hypothetical protein [Streptomyces chattanoogensis]|uniref:Uncharacterized protein n=1 Tax=Streptomyces chattanoogensis TaxID=66876 RepID=A0A0N0GX40_9ACTN|nr:hypothetical protein [Streptomyces chattanoogensis]KPC60711.1 hypothetical protein ADL29_28145 [Streptomyces chattanoogensis]